MKILLAALILILIGLQYKLWFGDGSLSEVVQLSRELEVQKQVRHGAGREVGPSPRDVPVILVS